jgi:hypothetical protein
VRLVELRLIEKVSLEWKKRDEPLTYIPPVVKHSFLDVFAFDNGSQGASM